MNDTSPELLSLLHRLNLTNTEQSLYLAGLRAPETTVSHLVTATGINRATAYHALAAMIQKGFAHAVKVDGKLAYTMLPPQDIDTLLAKQSDTIAALRHDVRNTVSLFPATPAAAAVVEKFHGADGVKRAVEKALYCQSRKWDIIAPKENFFTSMDKTYREYYKRTRKERRIQSRTLWEHPLTPRKLDFETILFRRPRYLPSHYRHRFDSTIILFDDTALFISSGQETTAILIRSETILSPLRILFDALWNASDKAG